MFGRMPPRPAERTKLRTPQVMVGDMVSCTNALIREYSEMYLVQAACCSFASATPDAKSSVTMTCPNMYKAPFLRELQN